MVERRNALMKKLLSFICIAGVLCALVACTESDTTNPANQNEANITENQKQENTSKEPEKPYYREEYPFIETSPHILIDTTGIEFPEPIF